MNEKPTKHLRDRIEDAIVTGRLAPGTRLDETSMSKRFGVSRTPIREALHQLSAVGMVEIRPHRGAVVSLPEMPRMLEMFEVMAELEAMCGRLAARRIDTTEAAKLSETLQGCKTAVEAVDPDAYYYENEKFHQTIYTASGNRFLHEQVITLQRRMAPFRRLQLRVRNRMQASQAEHEAIAAAILAGDAPKAAELLKAHIAIQGERFSDLIASLDKAQGS